MTVVVDQAGSGSFTTIQAGVDSLWSNLTPLAHDTLLVMPGDYAEDVQFPTPANGLCADYEGQAVDVLCSGGTSQTKVRSVRFPTAAVDFCPRWFWSFSGLSIMQSVDLGRHTGLIVFNDCQFEAGIVAGNLQECFAPNLFGCTIKGPSQLLNFRDLESPGFVSCNFRAAPLFVTVYCADLTFTNCTFTDASGASVIVRPENGNTITFDSCRFARSDTGLVLPGDSPHCDAYLRLTGCRFDSLFGAGVVARSPLTSPRGCIPLNVRTQNNTFNDCREAMFFSLGYPGRWISERDSISDCLGSGIVANVTSASISGLFSHRTGGPALEFYVQGIPTSVGAGSPLTLNISDSKILSAARAGIYIQHHGQRSDFPRDTLVSNVISNIDGDGIHITQSSFAIPYSSWLISKNTIYNCRGNGILLDAASMPMLLDRNTSVSNEGHGISLRTNVADTLRGNLVSSNGQAGLHLLGPGAYWGRFNDSYENTVALQAQGSYPSDLIISVAPGFCSQRTGDLSLRADSPIANYPGFGPIGSLQVGCPADPFAELPDAVLLVAPQPAVGVATFHFAPNALPMKLKVFDISGRLISIIDIPAFTSQTAWHRGLLGNDGSSAGIFWARLERGGSLLAGAKVIVTQ